MSSPTDARPVRASSLKIARATASRGASSSTKRSPSAPCSVAPSPRTASEIRKPSRPGQADDRRRVELGELEVGERRRRRRARAAGRSRRSPAGWWCATTARRRRPWPARPRARADRAAVVEQQRRRRPPSRASRARRPSSTSICGCSATTADSVRRIRRPVALPPACTIRRRAVAALEPEREVRRGGRRRSGTPSDSRSRKRVGRLGAQHLGGGAAHEPAPGGERVARGGAAASRRRRARRPGRPGPSRRRSRRAAGRRRASRARPRARRTAPRRARPRRRRRRRGRLALAAIGPTVSAWRIARLALAAPRRRPRPRRPGPPRAAGADPRARGRDERARLVRLRARRGAARRRASCCWPCTRSRTSPRSRSCARAGGGPIDADTYAVPGTYEAALRAAGGAVALVDALLRRGARTRRVRAAPARPPRRGGAGDGVLLLRQRRGRRAPRALARTAPSG